VNTLRRLWRITDWTDRLVTIASVLAIVLAAWRGTHGEVIAWVAAALWWSLYLGERLDVDKITAELWDLHLRHEKLSGEHEKLLAAVASRVHFPRGHRR
jgi:hypothetical protein